jgi:hypothetical protein
MPTLPEILTDEAKKSLVVDDCCTLIDAEVDDKGGISGLAIKAGYKAIKGVKPGFVRNVVTDLLPEFARVLDPMFQEATSGGKAVSDVFSSRSGEVAEALLGLTDEKAKHSKNSLVRGTYDKLRGTAKKNVEAAAPRLGKLIEKHTAA